MKYKLIPKIDRKTKKQIGFRYEFRRYNPLKKRNEPVLRASLPEHIRNASAEDEDVVAKYCLTKAAEEDAVWFRAKKRVEWRSKYSNFEILLESFEAFQKERAPNSYKMDCYYLESYCYSFFLGTKDANNFENWAVYYSEFRHWLSTVKPMKYKKDKLTKNTQNKIIKALNRFLAMIFEQQGLQLKKCPQYPKDQLNVVTAVDLIEKKEEIERLQAELKRIRPVSHDLFTVLLRSGLRLNEGLGLCSAFLIEGKIDGPKSKKIHSLLEKYGIDDYYGYVCLESQPRFEPARIKEGWKDPKTEEYWPTGSVPRKPLKSRKVIDPKWNRYIPIYDKTAWNILVRRWNEVLDENDSSNVETSPRNQLLFNDITGSMFYSDCVKAFDAAGLKFRSPHKLRHSFLTWFYDVTNEDPFLARKVGGHTDPESLQNYAHLAEQIGLEHTRKAQSKQRMKLAD